MTLLCELVAKETDVSNYTNYVFKCLDEDYACYTKYLMVTRFPNWNHRKINIGEIGYLSFFEIIAGESKWYDGNNMIPYRYSFIQFIKFISKPEDKNREFRC